MRLLVACCVSALGASFFTAWLLLPPSAVTTSAAVAAELADSDPTASLSGLFNADGLTSEEALNVAVYERLHKSVVNITTESVRVDSLFLMERRAEGAGSGSVIDKTGHILTNWHVVADARTIGVTLFNGDTYEAEVVGYDPPNDIAIIRIKDAPEEDLYPVTMGDSSRLKVGMRVLAIGNPFALERTLTTGVISSLNRSLEVQTNWTIKSIIQIDASINPGNSGGPLLDLHGRLIGINTAIASATGQSAGVGFAIPVDLVSRVVPELIAHGRVFRPEVGIQEVFETDAGLIVERLKPDGPAERAGIRGPTLLRQRRGPLVFQRLDRSTADLIVAIDGVDVKSVADFRDAIQRRKPGDTIVLTVMRERMRIDVPVELAGGPPANARTGVPGTRL